MTVSEDNQIKLYGFLIDQLTKYNSIIWQVPTALFAANFLALEKVKAKPCFVLGIILFNVSMIFAFYKMIIRQRAIIDSVRKVENSLKENYPDFIPNFKASKVSAPMLFVYILSLLNLSLLVSFIFQIIG